MEKITVTSGVSRARVLLSRLHGTWSHGADSASTSPETKKVIRDTVRRLYMRKPAEKHERIHLHSQFLRGNRRLRSAFPALSLR